MLTPWSVQHNSSLVVGDLQVTMVGEGCHILDDELIKLTLIYSHIRIADASECTDDSCSVMGDLQTTMEFKGQWTTQDIRNDLTISHYGEEHV